MRVASARRKTIRKRRNYRSTRNIRDLQGEGYRVPVAWVDTAREVFGRLHEPTTNDLTVKDRWEWLLHSILEHLRYYQDRDLSWSVIRMGESAQQTWQSLWRQSRELLDRIEAMSDTESRAEIQQDQKEGPR